MPRNLGPLFTCKASVEPPEPDDEDQSERIVVNTEFHQPGSVGDALSTMSVVIRGILESAVKMGTACGMSEDDVVNVLFGKE